MGIYFFDYLRDKKYARRRNYSGRTGYTEEQRRTMCQYGREYFDTELGYGGYYYDGRHEKGVDRMINYYNLNQNAAILDIGCAKGYILYEFFKKDFRNIHGCDISEYAIENSKEEVRQFLKVMNATKLDHPDNYFDLVIALSVYHNLEGEELDAALMELKRVSRDNIYLEIATYEDDYTLKTLKAWGVTVKSFYTPDEWNDKLKSFGLNMEVAFKIFK